MKVAVVGATGLVGSQMLRILEERSFPVSELIPVASENSIGKEVNFKGKGFSVVDVNFALDRKPHLALFSAGGNVSLELAPKFAAIGTTVIDNSSAWRMHPDCPLIVPEVNAALLTENDKIIANPNCSTIQLVMALAPLHEKYKLKRIVMSTYQSVTGTGKKAVDQLHAERRGAEASRAYPHPIDMNVIPQADVFLENNYTKEEMKLVNETRKILGDPAIQLTATAVRVPVAGGHSEAVNAEFYEEFELEEVRELLENTEGVTVQDDPSISHYPMPLFAQGKDEVFVGRLRRDETQPRTLNMWIVSDNLRKGAATNAVQIAEWLVKKEFL